MINFASPNVFDYQKSISKPSYTVRSAGWHKERYNKTQPIDWVSLYQDGLDNMVGLVGLEPMTSTMSRALETVEK